MKFRGKIVKTGNHYVFEPYLIDKNRYNSFTERLYLGDIPCSIEFSTVEKKSNLQLGLFNTIINTVSVLTGHTFNEILSSLEEYRPKSLLKSGSIVIKPLNEISTNEFSQFIDTSLNHLNREFDLNLILTEDQGKTKIINEKYTRK